MKRALLLALVQAVVILGWAGTEELARRGAPTFRVPLVERATSEEHSGRITLFQPADLEPRPGAPGALLTDAEIARFLAGAKEFHGPALVGFCPRDRVQRVCALARLDDPQASRPANARFWSRARLRVWQHEGWQVHADFVATRLFLPERLSLPAPATAAGWTLELAHREGRPPLPLRLFFEDRLVFAG
jgi:hypothetical protein